MTEFLRDKHIQYVKDLDSKITQKSYEYWLSEHLRMNGLYWGVVVLVTLDVLEETLPKKDVFTYIESCWDSTQGGYGSFPGHDAHILSTLSAIQIQAIYQKEVEELDFPHKNEVVSYIKGLQRENGSFQGDTFGEIDTRFTYTAINALSILGELDTELVSKGVDFIMKCENFDGGFGMVPGAESHAAQVFVCVATLSITSSLHLIKNKEILCEWLSERQVLPSGGLNGRPEKLPDVCYSWWVLSSLSILDKLSWIDDKKLKEYILGCQDELGGGFCDRPGNQTDVFHTCFGIAGLSLLESLEQDSAGGPVLNPVDPTYCMPYSTTKKFRKWPYDKK
ncbi:geranylgeranyl transferase type-2 subunit beta [[Candida] railenensis]|uniref:Geranylgeranyl transferase type-2 subunit beta n=1 Tax=[Candida] railenensis TaxID=45579 RepID=A0A9P0QRY0_9ASCO|nr:geranylgeranyl transferase type-2 subunit beta [[Candida] railenensis]